MTVPTKGFGEKIMSEFSKRCSCGQVHGVERIKKSNVCTVDCDENCKALENPRTFKDYKKAYEHWSNHGYLAGCSHGC